METENIWALIRVTTMELKSSVPKENVYYCDDGETKLTLIISSSRKCGLCISRNKKDIETAKKFLEVVHTSSDNQYIIVGWYDTESYTL